MSESLSIIVPCYNEAGNIRDLVEDLGRLLDSLDREAEVILVDDGSSDETWEQIQLAVEADHRVKGIRQMRNYGQSLAYQAGIESARGGLIVFYSADREVSSNYILQVLQKLDEGWDFVNTHRLGRWTGEHRALGSRIGNAAINAISGLKLNDRGSGLKGMRADLAATINLYGEMHRFIPDYASLHTERIIELETDFQARTYGESAYAGNVRSLSVFLDLITLAFLVHCAKKPFFLSPGRAFGFSGLVIGALGFFTAFYLTIQKLFFGASLADRPLFLVGILAAILGIVMLMLGVTGEMIMRAYYETGARKRYLSREHISHSTSTSNPNPEESENG